MIPLAAPARPADLQRPLPSRLIFVTGTDTGVGKTLLTSLLLSHLRRRGCRALAIKPFSSGPREDAQILRALQHGDLTLDELNPFHFPEPVAPLVAARKHRRTISLRDVLSHVRSLIRYRLAGANPSVSASVSRNPSTPTLLIEGVGGLLVPLGEGYGVLDLIAALAKESARGQKARNSSSATRLDVLVVASNQLGTLNHTLLAVRVLRDALRESSGRRSGKVRARPPVDLKVILMDSAQPDVSAASNPGMLAELIAPALLFRIPYLGPSRLRPETIRVDSARVRRTLEAIMGT